MDYYHTGTIGSKSTNGSPAQGGNGFEGTSSGYTLYETVLYGRTVTPDVTPSLPEFGAPAMAAVAGLAIGGAALAVARHRGVAPVAG